MTKTWLISAVLTGGVGLVAGALVWDSLGQGGLGAVLLAWLGMGLAVFGAVLWWRRHLPGRQAWAGLALSLDGDGRIKAVSPLLAARLGEKCTHFSGLDAQAAGRRFPWLGRLLVTAASADGVVLAEGRDESGRALAFEAWPVARETDGGVTLLLRDVSGREAAHRALAERERRYGQAVEQSPLGIALLSPQGVILEANPALGRLSGYPAGALVGKTVASLTHPEDWAAQQPLLEQLLSGSQDSYRLEKRYLRPDGKVLWAQVRAAAVRDGQGRVEFLLAQVEDITERHHQESALGESERRRQLAVAASGIGIWDWDQATGLLFWDERQHAIYGQPPSLAPTTLDTWSTQVHPEDREALLARWEALLASQERDFSGEFRIFRGDGALRYIRFAARVERDGEGRPLRVQGADLDISDIREALQASEQAKHLADTYLDIVDVVIAILDRDGRILRLNRKGLELLGGEEEAARQQVWSSYFFQHGEDQEAAAERIRRLLSGEVRELSGALSRLEDRNGEGHWLEWRCRRLTDSRGQAQGVVVAGADVTSLILTLKDLQLTRYSIDHARELMYWVERSGRIVYYNQAARELVEREGQNRREYAWEVDGELTAESWEEFWRQVGKGGGMTRETRLWRPDGQALAVEMTVDYLEFDERALLFVYARDIGGRKAAEAALARHREMLEATVRSRTEELEGKNQLLQAQIAERRLMEESLRENGIYVRALFDGVQDGVMVVDPDSLAIGEANAACVALLGLERDGLPEADLGRAWRLEPASRENLRAADWQGVLQRALAPEAGKMPLAVRRLGDGELLRLELRARRVTIHGRERCLVLVQDVSEVFAKEEERRRLALVAGSTHNTLMILNREGVIEWINQGFTALSGYTLEDVQGREPAQLLSGPETDRAAQARLHQCLAEGRRTREELAVYCKSGRPAWLDLEVQPILGDGDRVVQFAVLGTDVTERRLAQQAMEEAAARSLELAQAKSNFLANMSHEIRTPLNAILGLSHLALGTPLTPKQQDYLQKVHGAANNLLGIVNDVLDFSKIEAGKMGLEHGEFSLWESLERVLGLFSEKALEKGLELVCDLAPEVPERMVGDALRLEQVLTNLLGNALKFTATGTVRLAVTVVPEGETPDSLGITLDFAVVDTGIGIGEDKLACLFEPFEQADASTTRRFGGTGLGLAICRQLAQLMGGGIRVQSRVGEGSEFTFRGRFAFPEAPVPAPELQALTATTMLVVEPLEASRRSIAAQLGTRGIRVEGESTGFGLLARLRSGARLPFCLILDSRLPDLGDGALLAALGALPPGRCPPVLLLSGGADCPEGLDNMPAHWTILSRPVTPLGLEKALLALVHRRDGAWPAVPVRERPLLGLSLLVAEDNPVNQMVIRDLLQEAGARVEVVGDGEQALQRLEQEPPPFDGVLMDVQMPVMDGLAATRAIRSRPALAALPVIALTAHAQPEEMAQCLAAGMNDHLAKPVDPERLFACLGRWITPAQPLLRTPPTGGERRPALVLATVDGAAVAAAETASSGSGLNGGEGAEPDWSACLPGLDGGEAWRRMGAKAKLFRRVLEETLKWRDGGQRLSAALAQGDRQQAGFLAHSLKGMAGTLSAKAIQSLAQTLERSLRQEGERPEEWAALAAQLDEALQGLCDGIQAFLAVPEAVRPASPGTAPAPAQPLTESLVARLETLLELCRDSRGEALEWAEALAPALGEVGRGGAFQPILRELRDFDFEAVIPLLEALVALAQGPASRAS